MSIKNTPLDAAQWLPAKPHKPSWLHWPHRKPKTPKETPPPHEHVQD